MLASLDRAVRHCFGFLLVTLSQLNLLKPKEDYFAMLYISNLFIITIYYLFYSLLLLLYQLIKTIIINIIGNYLRLIIIKQLESNNGFKTEKKTYIVVFTMFYSKGVMQSFSANLAMIGYTVNARYLQMTFLKINQ